MNNVSTLEQLARDFTSLFKRRVFRLETLDYYDAENERDPYARFLAGQPVDPAWREPWKRLVRDVRASGRTMERVHVVSEPVSDYVRFSLLHGYPANVEAGEDVRILDRMKAFMELVWDGDFWLFDDELAAFLEYDRDGRPGNVYLYRDEPRLRFFCETRDEALRLATPLDQYVATNNITNERTQAA